MPARNYSNTSIVTTLNGTITAGATSLIVTADTGYPAVPFTIQIEDEVILVTARTGVNFSTVTRGYDGTTGVGHDTGVDVKHVVVALDYVGRPEVTDIVALYDDEDQARVVVETNGDITVYKDNGSSVALLWDQSDGAFDVAGLIRAASGWYLELEASSGSGINIRDESGIRFYVAPNSVGDLTFYKKNGTTVSLLWDESDNRWEFADRPTVGTVPVNTKVMLGFQTPGDLAVNTGTKRFYFPYAFTVTGCWISVMETAPTGASVIVDVNKNAAGTIFTTQGNRPEIAIAAFRDTAIATPNITAFAAGDYLMYDVDQIGSTLPGTGLILLVEGVWT